jgi:hypothetical protein
MLSILKINKGSFYSQISNGSKSKNPLIWVYDIINLSLVKGAPFNTKTMCGETLGINRQTVTAYLDNKKLYKNKFVFSYSPLNNEELSK